MNALKMARPYGNGVALGLGGHLNLVGPGNTIKTKSKTNGLKVQKTSLVKAILKPKNQ